MSETWKQFTERLIVDFCNKSGMRTFSLQEFQEAKENEIKAFSEIAKTPFATIRREMQTLRDEGILGFVDNRGTYTLRRPIILEGELVEDAPLKDMVGFSEPNNTFEYEQQIVSNSDISKLEKREYIIETYARDRGWVKKAKDCFGFDCLHPGCRNTFLKPDGERYIEVHHIIPLFQGGEDGLWNLTVVCAHHHRMAHFAETIKREELQKQFLGIANEKLQQAIL